MLVVTLTTESMDADNFLVNESSLPIEQLSAAGYGEYQPLAPNDSVQNRAKNRRVDIVVLTSPLTRTHTMIRPANCSRLKNWGLYRASTE